MNEKKPQDQSGDNGTADERWQHLVAECGPPMPDDPVVCYDTSMEEGRAELQAYREWCAEQYRRADEAWARKYPGIEFRRLTDRMNRHAPPVKPEPEG